METLFTLIYSVYHKKKQLHKPNFSKKILNRLTIFIESLMNN